MTAWLLLIIITMSNGDIKVGKTLPESYEYGTEAACRKPAEGTRKLNDSPNKPKQIAKYTPICFPLTEQEFEKYLPPKA